MRRGLVATAGLVLAVLAWLLLVGPTSLGGRTAYVTTHGTSMEPAFHAGDLAVLRPSGSYAVGDVVAYRSALLDTVVMHRVVAVQGGRFTLQGDNNDWLDPETPEAEHLIGELAVRIPQGGAWLDRLTSPPALALVTLLVLTTTGGAAVRSRHGRRRRAMSRQATPAAASTGVTAGALAFGPTAVAALGVLGVVFAALGWGGLLVRWVRRLPAGP